MDLLQSPPVIAALVAGAIALAIALLTHRLSLWRDSRASRIAGCHKFRSTVVGVTELVPAAQLHWDKSVIPVLVVIANDVERAAKELGPHIGVKSVLLHREVGAFSGLCREAIPRALSAAEVLYGTGPSGAASAKLKYHASVEKLLSYASEA